jgi:DnaJ-class molecular chaperone
MNIKEAEDLLGVSKNSSEEEIKKALKKNQAKYHPDIYKNDNGEMFKKVTEAYDVLTAPAQQIPFGPFTGFNVNFGNDINMNDFITNFFTQQVNPNLGLDLALTFQEFVMGVTKKISYKRKDYVAKKDEEATLTLDIKPFSQQQIPVNNAGHLINSRQRGMAIINLRIADPKFKAENGIIFLNQDITLHDAVHGKEFKIDLYYDTVTFTTPNLLKNKDVIRCNLVNLKNNYFKAMDITFNVIYPNNIKEII